MIKLWHLTLAALPLGVVIGFAAPDLAIAIEPMGLVFLRLIKMLIPLLVFATVVTGIVSVDKLSSLASIGTKAVLAYGVTTLFAIFWGISLGALSGVGSGGDIRLEPSSGLDTPEPLSMYDSLIQWIPVNPLASFVDGNILQILTFSVLFAVALLMVGAHGRPIVRAVESLSHVMLAMTSVVMLAAPIGVCALIAIAIARHGADVLTTLSSLLAVYLLGCLFQIVIVYGVIVRFLVGMSFAKFIRGMLTPMSVAIGTTSSAATLPTTIQSVEDEFGVPRRISGFVLPLGATINMDGTGVYLGVVSYFAANLAGVTLSPADLASLTFTAVVASVGAAGVPGGSLLMVTVVLASLGLPMEVFALVASIDRIVDLARTLVNVLGDSVVCLWVAYQDDSGSFDTDSGKFSSDNERFVESQTEGMAES